MPQLPGIAGDQGALAAMKNRQRGGEIDLGGFVDDDEVEDAALEGEDAVDVIGGGDPHRQEFEQGLEVELEEFALLRGGRAAAEGFTVAFENGPPL